MARRKKAKHSSIYDAGTHYMVQIGTHPNRIRKTFPQLSDAIAYRDYVKGLTLKQRSGLMATSSQHSR